MKKMLILLAFTLLSYVGKAFAVVPVPVAIQASTVVVAVSTAAGGPATLTVSTPTATGVYSAGYYNYITNVHVEMYATSTLTGGATPTTCTTTNLPDAVVLKFPTAAATGTNTITDMQFANPLLGTIGKQVLISCPSTTNVIWNIVVGYFQAS